MQEQTTLTLILGTSTFEIPSNFRFLNDIKPDIYNTLMSTHKYDVKSKVSEEVLESFIRYWTKKEIPEFTENNISEYEKLSQEFDLMTDIIQIYKKYHSQVNSLTIENNFLNTQISDHLDRQETNQEYHRRGEINFQNILDTFFNNVIKDQPENFLRFHELIYKQFRQQNEKLIDLYSRNHIIYENDLYVINDENKTAGLLSCSTKKYEVVIPRSICQYSKEYIITSVLINSFENNSFTAYVSFAPNSEVSYIDEFSFRLSGIQYITLPKSVTKICAYAFNHCDSLISVKFPVGSKLETIEGCAFSVSSLKTLTIPPNFIDFKFGWCSFTNKLTNITILPKEDPCIASCNEGLIVKKSAPNADAFDVLLFAPRDIKIAQIPSFVKRIAPKAFNCCEKLKRVEFLEGSELEIIEFGAFDNANSLEFISIPSSTTKIEANSFYNCINLKNIVIPNNSKLVSIGDKAFCNTKIQSISIPSDIKQLQDFWCQNTPLLTNITIFEKAEKNVIKYDDFILGKSNLESDDYDVLLFAPRNIKIANIPPFIKKIGPASFHKCSQLEQVNFTRDSKLQLICNHAFASSSIKSIIIPSQVYKLEKKSFSNCYFLEEVDFAENSELRSFGDRCFNLSSLKKIRIPSKVEEIQLECFGSNENLTNIFLSPSNKHFMHLDNKFFIGKSDPTISNYDVLVFAHPDLRYAIIPSFIKRIGSFAFSTCKKLVKVEFSKDSKLEIIGESAFDSSPIEEIIIPPHVRKVSDMSFSSCEKLRKVEFEENSDTEVIGEESFSYTKLTSFVFPPNVDYIHNYAFSCCQLKIVEISENSKLFSICDSMFDSTYNPPETIMIPPKLRGTININIYSK